MKSTTKCCVKIQINLDDDRLEISISSKGTSLEENTNVLTYEDLYVDENSILFYSKTKQIFKHKFDEILILK